MIKIKRKSTKLIILCFVLQALSSAAVQAEEFFSINNGELQRPTGYRQWIYVGTPVTPNELNNGKAAFPEFHNAYIDPDSWAYWKSHGVFRDGTILIKELVSIGSKAGVSGKGYFMGEFVGLEATIKSKKHFPREPGNWAYFSFSTKNHKQLNKTAKAFPTAACNACHQGAAENDFVFTQYYPILGSGKGQGENAIGGKLSDLNNSYIEPTSSK